MCNGPVNAGCNDQRMILEHAVLQVTAGQELAFEEAFATAKGIISAAAGFRGLLLCRCLEVPGRYLLLVEWSSLEDHTEGFRGSDAYQEWRALLHRFYDPFPAVDNYEAFITQPPG